MKIIFNIKKHYIIFNHNLKQKTLITNPYGTIPYKFAIYYGLYYIKVYYI